MTSRTFDQYGGRKRRYKVTTGRLLGIMDPWERRSLEFCNEHAFDLWLLRRADPAVVTVDIKPPPLKYLKAGRLVSCKADLAVLQGDGKFYELIVWGDSVDLGGREAAFKTATEAHQVKLRVTSTAELRTQSVVLTNMERVRQTLVVWLDHELENARADVLDAIGNGAATRSHIRARLSRAANTDTACPVDAAIYRLFFERKLSFDLTRRFQDDSIIKSL